MEKPSFAHRKPPFLIGKRRFLNGKAAFLLGKRRFPVLPPTEAGQSKCTSLTETQIESPPWAASLKLRGRIFAASDAALPLSPFNEKDIGSGNGGALA